MDKPEVTYTEIEGDDDRKELTKFNNASKLVSSSSQVAAKLSETHIVPDAKYWNVNYATQLLKGTVRIAQVLTSENKESNILLATVLKFLKSTGFMSTAILNIVQNIFMMKNYIEYSPIPFIKQDLNFYINVIFSLTNSDAMTKQISYRLTYVTAIISFISQRTVEISQLYGLKGSKKRKAFIKEDPIYEKVQSMLGNLSSLNKEKFTKKLSKKAFSLPGITQTDQTELSLSLIDSIMYAIAPLSQSGKNILFEFIGSMIVADTIPSKYCRIINRQLVLNSTMETRVTFQNAITELTLRLPETITSAMNVGKV